MWLKFSEDHYHQLVLDTLFVCSRQHPVLIIWWVWNLYLHVCYRSSQHLWSQIKCIVLLLDITVDELHAWSSTLLTAIFFYLVIRYMFAFSSIHMPSSCCLQRNMCLLMVFILFCVKERTTWSLGFCESTWEDSLWKYTWLHT